MLRVTKWLYYPPAGEVGCTLKPHNEPKVRIRVKSKTCSIRKYYKHMIKDLSIIRYMVKGTHILDEWLERLINLSEKKFNRESKKGKMSHLQRLELLTNP